MRRALPLALAVLAGAFISVAWYSRSPEMVGLQEGLAQPYPAPQIAVNAQWLNSSPLKIPELKGKVVLVDFWTYSCINCLRTLPYITQWDEKYREKGLVIIGVHAPEFAFEKETSNVKKAIAAHGIKYPVAMDNGFATWENYKNRYWPTHYLIDKEGQVVYTHFGEGKYDVMEHNIRHLLGLEGSVAREEAAPASKQLTPEIYLGRARAKKFANFLHEGKADYHVPPELEPHHWAIGGSWTADKEKLVAGPGGKLRLNFTARKVFLVMGSPDGKPITVDISLNGQPHRTVVVTGSKLYTLIEQAEEVQGIMDLMPRTPGLAVYAFTFG